MEITYSEYVLMDNDLKKVNVPNLEILQSFIENDVPDSSFNMRLFRSSPCEEGLMMEEFESFNECGTIGCALGWLPHALVKNGMSEATILRRVQREPDHTLDFLSLGKDFLGIGPWSNEYAGDFSEDGENSVWEHLFSSRWSVSGRNWKTGPEMKQEFLQRCKHVIARAKEIQSIA